MPSKTFLDDGTRPQAEHQVQDPFPELKVSKPTQGYNVPVSPFLESSLRLCPTLCSSNEDQFPLLQAAALVPSRQAAFPSCAQESVTGFKRK